MAVLRARVSGIVPGVYSLGDVVDRIRFLEEHPGAVYEKPRKARVPGAPVSHRQANRGWRYRNVEKCRKLEKAWKDAHPELMQVYRGRSRDKARAYRAFRYLFGDDNMVARALANVRQCYFCKSIIGIRRVNGFLTCSLCGCKMGAVV